MRAYSCWIGCAVWGLLGCSESHSSGAATAGTAGKGGSSVQSAGGSSGGVAQGEGGDSPSSGTTANGGKPSLQPPAPTRGDCDDLGAVGAFEEITPPEVKAGIGEKDGANNTKGGTFAMSVDPVNQGTVYVGTLFRGVWKTSDCGASWEKIATGAHAEDVNRGMNWTFAIDPQAPNVVFYTNSGYGSNGLFKSTDGGVSWTDVWSIASQPELGKSFQYNFANVVVLDPSDHEHVLLTFHEPCLPPHNATCIAESFDAGVTWKLLEGEPTWNGAEGQVIWFLENSRTWLWGSQTNGFWRSADSGKTWRRIPGMETSHLQGSQIVRAKNGTFYASAADAIWSSPDGEADTWKAIPNTGPILGGLVSDGTTLYASTGFFEGFGPTKYLRSAESDGKIWEIMPSPTIQLGGTLGYDPGHKLLYSSNLDSGLWRVIVE